MDKRKKLVKLFYEINDFIRQNSLNSDPYAFLLNKFWLSLQNKRPAANTLVGISKSDFSVLNNEFSDRLGRDFVLSLSITSILSLPTEKVFELQNVKVQPKQSVLVLADSIILPYETEKKIQLFIGYSSEKTKESPFKNIEYYPVSREADLSVSIQATLFDFMNNDNTQLRPQNFDVVIDDAVNYSFPSESLLNTLSVLMKYDSSFYLIVKKVFLSSPLTRKDKKSLYSHFEAEEIDRFADFLQLRSLKKVEGRVYPQSHNVVIRDLTSGKVLELDRGCLDFNHLYTFNDDVTADQLALVSKIEEHAGATCGDYFRFFLGMFRNAPIDDIVETLRKNAGYRPLVTSKEILPFRDFRVKKYIYPDPQAFFQIPPESSFESKKLLMRYLSVKPVFAYDEEGLYFMNDVAAVVPRTPDIDLYFAEGYLNSKLVEFFYKIKFPHHNKFLKKNFNKIPFVLCGKNIQNIIANEVRSIRRIYHSMVLTGDREALQKELDAIMERLDGFVYQLFKLSLDEINIIERYVCENSDSQETDDEKQMENTDR